MFRYFKKSKTEVRGAEVMFWRGELWGCEKKNVVSASGLRWLLVVLIGWMSAFFVEAKPTPMREFTSSEGKTIRASALSLEGGMVTIRNRAGRVYKIELSILSAADVEFLKKYFAEDQGGDSGVKGEKKKKGKFEFSDSFESSRWWGDWNLEKAPENAELVKMDLEQGLEEVAHGKKALRIAVPKGSHLGSSISYKFANTDGEEPEEVYFRYYLFFGKDWNYGGKMPGFGGTYDKAGWGGRPSKGLEGWSARGSSKTSDDGKTCGMETYCYHADMPGEYGDQWIWRKGKKPVELKKRRWYCVEQYCRMNTPGKKDGIIRAWVDGLKVLDKKDIRMRHNPDLKIESIWFNIFHGGKDTAPNDCYVYIDDVVISKEYIGERE